MCFVQSGGGTRNGLMSVLRTRVDMDMYLPRDARKNVLIATAFTAVSSSLFLSLQTSRNLSRDLYASVPF